MSEINQRRLPPRPSLKFYKNEAKMLIQAYRGGDPAAQQRVRTWFPNQGDAKPRSLHHMHRIIAKEHGFKDWTEFTQAIVRANQNQLPQADRPT